MLGVNELMMTGRSNETKKPFIWRAPAFGAGLLVVGLMWVKLFIHVATRGVVA